jgi:protein SCO1
MKRTFLLAGLGLVVGLAGLLLAALVISNRPYSLHGSVIEPAVAAPAIALPASTGQAFDLAEQHGRLVLVFFGYTSCPDVCPTTLGQLHHALDQLGSQAGQVEVVFITVDPQRDTQAKLQRYLTSFGTAFVGLTGTTEQLDPVWKAYGVYHQIQPIAGSDMYTVDHTAFVYLIDPQGRLRLTYPYGTSSDEIYQDIRYLLKEG